MRRTVLLLLVSALPAAAADKPKLVVMPLQVAGGVDREVGDLFTEAVTEDIGRKGFFDAISQKEIGTLMAVDRQRQLLGCDESNCLTELAGATGARFILTGSVAKLGDNFQLTLQVLDSTKSQPLGRSTRFAKTLEALRSGVPFAVAESTGTPLPPPPSRIVPITLIGVGGAAIVGGALYGLMALADEQRYAGELQSGATTAGVLQEQSFYQREAQRLGLQKTISLIAMGVGAALIVAGIIVMPSEQTRGSVALVPMSNGAALVGSF
jgi:TolB-like protein